RLSCRAVVVPVADEPVMPGDEDLPVLGDPHGHPGQGLADGADLVAGGPVHRGGGGGLREPVSLDDGDPRTAEEMAEPFPEGGAAGHRVAHPAAERGAELAVDQPVEEVMLKPQREARSLTPGSVAGAERAAPGDRRPRSLMEDRALDP